MSIYRYEIGRHSAPRWQLWNSHLGLIADRGGNVVAANNLYDLVSVAMI